LIYGSFYHPCILKVLFLICKDDLRVFAFRKWPICEGWVNFWIITDEKRQGMAGYLPP
jgi:hypothetical protein